MPGSSSIERCCLVSLPLKRVAVSRRSNDSRHSFLAFRGKGFPLDGLQTALPFPSSSRLRLDFRSSHNFPVPILVSLSRGFPTRFVSVDTWPGGRAREIVVACRTFVWSYLPFTGKSLFTRVVRGFPTSCGRRLYCDPLDSVIMRTMVYNYSPGSGERPLVTKFIKALTTE